MTSIKKSGTNKFPYAHVKITWWDITQSNEAWIDKDDILKNDISVCEDTGYIFLKLKINYGCSLPILMMRIRAYLLEV
jgi:hypothetical protein